MSPLRKRVANRRPVRALGYDVELMPYFLNNPFSCAMTIGEQSVSAMMPNFIFAVSGASLA